MIELILIVVPCTLVGCAIVLVAMRMGWLPTLQDGGQAPPPRFSDGPRPAPGARPPGTGSWSGGGGGTGGAGSGSWSGGAGSWGAPGAGGAGPGSGGSGSWRATGAGAGGGGAGGYWQGRTILDRRSAWSNRSSYVDSSWSGLRAAGVAAMVLMAGWIIFWVVLLIVGLHLILSAA